MLRRPPSPTTLRCLAIRRTATRDCPAGEQSQRRPFSPDLAISNRIPADWREWRVDAAKASALAYTLALQRDDAMLFRTLATLQTDIPLFGNVDELEWNGPDPAFPALATRLDSAVTQAKRPARQGAGPGNSLHR